MRRGAAVLLLLVLAGCGGADTITDEKARDAVEHASGLRLKVLDPPEPEVKTMFAATGKGQFVQLYVLRTDADAKTLGEAVPPGGGTVRSLVHRNLFVVASGTKADAVVKAVAGL